MKIHPVPSSRRYDVPNGCRQKKLQRLPHIFAKVLELPFRWDADVAIVETEDSLRFSAVTDGISDDVRADAVEIYPGVTKVIIRGNGVVDLLETEFDLDVWRFRLPGSMRAELASAAYEHGELVVTVPKRANDATGIRGGSLVFVQ